MKKQKIVHKQFYPKNIADRISTYTDVIFDWFDYIYIYVYDLVILRYKTNEKNIFWEFVFFYVFIKCKIPLLDSPKYMYMIWWDRCQKKDSQKYMCVSCSHQFVLLTMIVFLCMMTVWRFSCLFQYTCIYIYMHNFVKPMQTTTKYVYLEDTGLTVQSDRWSMVYMHAVCVYVLYGLFSNITLYASVAGI